MAEPAAPQGWSDATDTIFRQIEANGALIDGLVFADCLFDACSLVEATLRRCRFLNCTFRACDLSLARVDGSLFSGTRFDACRLIGVDWTAADWTSVRLGGPNAFHDCNLSHASFIGLSLPGLKLTGCRATDVDFRETDLAGADLTDSDLALTLFAGSNLAGADLRGAHDYHIVPGETIIRGARFSLPEALSLLTNLDIRLVEGD